MPKCPSCGLETARTVDWCCQYCGYPLLSGDYPKLDKSYEQLKEEKLKKTVAETEPNEPVLPQAMRPEAGIPLPAQNESAAVGRESGEAYGVGRVAITKPSFVIALLYLVAITTAELVTALVSPLGGGILHILLLLGLVSHASFAAKQVQHKVYLALALAPLIRLLSLSMPLTKFPQIYWYAIITVPLLVAVFAVMQRLNLRAREVGLTLNGLPVQLLVGLTGIPFGIAEFYILRPDPLVESLAWQAVVLPALILLVGTGFAEELTFRGVMQTSAEEALGRWGWVYIAVVFTVMHTGYLSLADMGLVLLVGLFFGWVVKKTGSLIGVILSHGITNIVLYLIVPFLI